MSNILFMEKLIWNKLKIMFQNQLLDLLSEGEKSF